MKIRVITAIAIAGLAGCGGSNDGSATNPTTDPTIQPNVIRTLPNGNSLIEFEAAGKAVIAMGIVGDNSIYSPSSSGFDWFYEGDNSHGGSYSDNISVDDKNLYVYRTNTKNNQEVVYVSEVLDGGTLGGYSQLVAVSAFGDSYTSSPLSGNYTYEGVHVIIPNDLRGLRGTSIYQPGLTETGSFKMVVDFSNDTGTLIAGTGNYLTSYLRGERFVELVEYQSYDYYDKGKYEVLTNDIVIDTVNGTFASDNVTITNYENSTTALATLNGVFNGNAAGVSALYSANDSPGLVGVISGARID